MGCFFPCCFFVTCLLCDSPLCYMLTVWLTSLLHVYCVTHLFVIYVYCVTHLFVTGLLCDSPLCYMFTVWLTSLLYAYCVTHLFDLFHWYNELKCWFFGHQCLHVAWVGDVIPKNPRSSRTILKNWFSMSM